MGVSGCKPAPSGGVPAAPGTPFLQAEILCSRRILLGLRFSLHDVARFCSPAVTSLLIAGIAGGAIWAGIAAGLRYWRNVPEVLTTLLLVAVASQVVGYAFRFESILLAPITEGQGTQVQQTLQVPEGARIPRITIFGNSWTGSWTWPRATTT